MAFGATVLVVEMEEHGVPVGALHLLHVLDHAAVFLQELLDGLDGLAVARPRVVGEVIAALSVEAGLTQHFLQGHRIKLEQYQINLYIIFFNPPTLEMWLYRISSRI